jgi:hypothetical protein
MITTRLEGTFCPINNIAMEVKTSYLLKDKNLHSSGMASRLKDNEACRTDCAWYVAERGICAMVLVSTAAASYV